MERHLTLAIAGLYGPQPGPTATVPIPSLPQLETLFARATRINEHPVAAAQTGKTRRGFNALLCELFDVAARPDADLPVAAITRLADSGARDDSWWVRADPVHLEPHGDGLILSGSDSLDLSRTEADQMVAQLHEIFGSDGWRLEAPEPGRWYLRPPEAARIVTHCVDDILGQDVHDYLPGGPDARAWHTLLNEAQILLHTAQINIERERQGRPVVNSLWFWGGGVLPPVTGGGFAEVWSDEPLSRGLAQLCGVAAQSVPAGAMRWIELAMRPGAQLLVLDQARAAVQYGDSSTWLRFMEWFEELWLAPLLAALRARELASLTLRTDCGAGRRLTRPDLGRWWRRRRRLSSYR
ncbi:MAG: hypothetical protein ACYDDO_11085 [Acidiferrobacterales bacterium]